MDSIERLMLRGTVFYSVWENPVSGLWHVAKIVDGGAMYGYLGEQQVWAMDFTGHPYETRAAAAQALSKQLTRDVKHESLEED